MLATLVGNGAAWSVATLPAIKVNSHPSRRLVKVRCWKVFFGVAIEIPKAADALHALRGEGPHRFIQNRSRASVTALKSDATTE